MPAESAAQVISPQYIAGFLDGEGNITMLACNRYREKGVSYALHVGFTNRDTRPLLAIKALYGGIMWAKKRNARSRQTFELRVGRRKDVQRLLEDVKPFLMCKQEQAEVGLSFLSLGKVRMEVTAWRKTARGKNGKAPILSPMAGEQEQRQFHKDRLTILNARGVAA